MRNQQVHERSVFEPKVTGDSEDSENRQTNDKCVLAATNCILMKISEIAWMRIRSSLSLRAHAKSIFVWATRSKLFL